MENLKLNIYTTALDLLKQGEQLLQTAKVPEDISENEKAKLLALTYNNIGCFYKKKNQANVALKYLKTALDLETQSQQDSMNIAGTMLNICAILSMLKKYNKKIIVNLQIGTNKQYFMRRMPQQRQTLYNLGVEHEYLNEFDKALECFDQSVTIIQTQLDGEEQMMKLVSEGITGIQNKIKQKGYLSSSQIIVNQQPPLQQPQIQPMIPQGIPGGTQELIMGHKRGQSSRGSYIPQISELNVTHSSRGSYGFDTIKNKQSVKSSNDTAPMNPYITQPLDEIKEELNMMKKQMFQRKFQSQLDNYPPTGQAILPQSYQKGNILTSFDPNSKVVQNYRKAATNMKLREKDNTSRLSMSEIEEEKSTISTRQRREGGKKQPMNKSQLNKTVRLQEEVNLPKLNKIFQQPSEDSQPTLSSFYDNNQEMILATSTTAIKYNNKQLPPRAPSIQNKKKILLNEINDKMRINSTSDNIRETSNSRNTPSKQHNPYKTQMQFVGQPIENTKRSSLKQIMSQAAQNTQQVLSSERSKSSENKYQSSMKRIEKRLNELQGRMTSMESSKEDDTSNPTNAYGMRNSREESRSAYYDKASHTSSKKKI